MKKQRLPFLAVFCGALALAPLTYPQTGNWLEGDVFGEGVPAMSQAEMAMSRGGVGLTVTKPRASQTHYINNPRFIADVFNYQSQGQTTLYLHHGTSKTGSRSVTTAAPGYAGHIESRFKHLGGTADLVVKYYDTSSRALKVARVLPAQKMHGSVKLRRLVVHNVRTTLNQTSVNGSVIARIVDSQIANQDLTVSDSIDAILAQCPRRRRTQFQLSGMDNGVSLHTINTGTSHCAHLEDHITYNSTTFSQLDAVAQACMQELFLGALAMDPTYESYHIYVVKDLIPVLHGFSSSLAQGAVIRESDFSDSPWWRATVVLHEIGHGTGLAHRPTNDPECQSTNPHERAVMCVGSTAGKLLSTQECDAFYNNLEWLEDHN